MRELISLYALRSFEAAARLSSFHKAATELNLTSAAVAHQVKRLEDDLGVELFRRLHRGVALNEHGHEFLQAVERAFAELRNGEARVRERARASPIRVVALHGFIEKWLAPRLNKLRTIHPNLRIELSASEKPVDLEASTHDVWISHATEPPYPGKSELLFSTRISPVCTPTIADTLSEIGDDEFIREYMHLYDTFWRDDWRHWFETQGQPAHANGKEWLGFDLYSMVIQAAVDGMGLAIGHDALIEKELSTGLLVAPFAASVESPRKFFVTYRSGVFSDELKAFHDWLQDEAAYQRDRNR